MARSGGHDSHAVVGGGLVFVAGQLPIAPDVRRPNNASVERRQVAMSDDYFSNAVRERPTC
jgi:enamine deaminase RidA (YjgF/YER057c/UK114 family)